MENDLKHDDIDIIGESVLRVLSRADAFNSWIYDTIKPYCKGKVLEIGSGIGSISQFFIAEQHHIFLSDLRENYCNTLKERFKASTTLLGVAPIDLTDPDFDKKYKEHLNAYNTVFALNVVEHIEDDRLAMQNCKKLLVKGGRIIILVPSYQWLFNTFDEGLDHYRRYTKKRMAILFNKVGINIEHQQYFNAIGILGWYVSGSILKQKTINEGQISLYNALVPIIKRIDQLLFNSIGLSTITIGRV